MKKLIRGLLTGFLLLSANMLYAQVNPAVSIDTSTTEGLLHYILDPLDKSQISTGYLAAWGAPILPMTTFNGTLTDSNRIDMNLWRTLYFQLQTSYCGSGSNSLASITMVNNTIRQNTADSVPAPIPL